MSSKPIEKMRILVTGSLFRGEAIFETVTKLEKLYPGYVEVCAASTDDPLNNELVARHALNRVWRYIKDWAAARDAFVGLVKFHGVPVHTGRIKSPGSKSMSPRFRHLLTHVWKPNLIIMGTFGEVLPLDMIKYPKYGTFNCHPANAYEAWPTATGGNPFEQMLKGSIEACSVVMHKVDAEIDHGPAVCYSRPVPVRKGDTVLDLHQRTSDEVRVMVEEHILTLVKKLNPDFVRKRGRVIQPKPAPYPRSQPWPRPCQQHVLNVA